MNTMKKLLKTWIVVIVISIVVPLGSPYHAKADVGVSARNAILMEQSTGRVLYEKSADEPRRIASITKIMTAIIAIESGKLDEKVTVSKRAVYTEGSSIYLKEGEKIPLKDLLYGLMLRSGNDAAVAIAEHVGGSLEGFVHLMNQKAAKIGMTNTDFANPHGLDDHEDHHSTAYDMALLTRYAMDNEQYRKISGTEYYRCAETNKSEARGWKNKNKLVTGMYKYSTGGKTGFTKRAKRTLVSTASKDGMDLIAVTLNGPDDWNDHMQMFNWGFDTFKRYKIIDKGHQQGIDEPFYKNRLYTKREFIYPLSEKEEDQLRVKLQLLKPNEEKWKEAGIPSPVGQLEIFVESEKIGEMPVFADDKKKNEDSWLEKVKSIFFMVMGAKTDG